MAEERAREERTLAAIDHDTIRCWAERAGGERNDFDELVRRETVRGQVQRGP